MVTEKEKARVNGSGDFQEEDRKGTIVDVSKRTQMMSKPRWSEDRGISFSGTCLRLERHPVYRWLEPGRGGCMERGNLGVDANGKVTSGVNHEDESTDATPRGGLPRSSDDAE